MGEALVGTSAIRKEGRSKVTGASKYVDDLHFEDMLYGVTVRSSVPRGKIKGIHFEGDLPWNEFTVVTAKDIPGENYVALIENDQPFLADGVVNHREEAILLLAHPDRYLVEKARDCVRVEYEELPAIYTIEESETGPTVWRDGNCFKSYLVEKGDVDSVWKSAHQVFEGEYRTGAQEQLYIENNGMIARANKEEGVTIWGSMQCPYYIHKALKPLFGLEGDQVRVIQSETGGGFGGKEEYPSILAGHAALLALKSGKPVKMIFSRAEDMACTTKRHPSRTRIKTAVDKDGKLLAQDIEFVVDGGAYATLSAVVLSRGTIHAAGPYLCPNVRVRAKAMATNLPPHGAFRGFGAPQSIFGMERHLDRLARDLGLTPAELRRRNFIKKGELTATSQELREEVDFDGLMTRGMKEADFAKKQTEYQKLNAKGGRYRYGMGFATFMHGAGFTGSGEKFLESIVGIEGLPSGKLRVLAGSTEIGQGTQTIFCQIAADALGLEYDDIEVSQPDTADVPNSGPTVASRTCMIVGKLVESAALGLKHTLVEEGLLGESFNRIQFLEAVQKHCAKHGKFRCYSQYKQPKNIQWDDEKYRGDAYATFAWAIYLADVTIDTLTYETRVNDFVALQEVGKVVNPTLAMGQIEGGVAQGVGYAIYEKVNWQNGVMVNNQMTNYIMPTAADLPEIRVFFEEQNQNHGPSGAKGIGELPMDGPGPAILNAVEDALGVAVNEIPMLPEDLMNAVEASR